jgi:Fe-S-cluster-containing dehydrogenase component
MNTNANEKCFLIVNLQRCVGCYTCSVACKVENKLQSKSFVHIQEVTGKLSGIEKIHESVFQYWLPIFCMQCENPECLPVCPTEAISKEINGIVHIDSSRCVGCLNCISACPFNAIVELNDENAVGKCDMCFERMSMNQKPFCVVCCPTRALEVVNVSENKQRLQMLKDSGKLHALKGENDRMPSVLYIPPFRWDGRNLKSVNNREDGNEG